MYPVGFCSSQPRCIVDYLCFGNSVEGLILNYDVTDSFDEVSELNMDVTEEIFLDHIPMTMIIYGYNQDRNITKKNTDWSEWVPTYVC